MPTREPRMNTKSCESRRAGTKTYGTEFQPQAEHSAHTASNSERRIELSVSRMSNRIRKIQLAKRSFMRRDVFDTVRRELIITRHRLNQNASSKERRRVSHRPKLKEAERYLESVSASKFPPVLAAFAGAGTFPFRLYSSVSFDRLHAWDYGVVRMLTDDAYKVFDSEPQYYGYSKTKIVSIANARIQDVPRSASIRRITAFRKTANETQAGITGKMRRDLLCFLWSSVMGISRRVNPDNDKFVQVLLKADLFQRKLMGINMSLQSMGRTLKDIQDIAELGFEVGKDVVSLMKCAVNTKVHRIMRHVLDHLVDYGCIRKGSTDINETQHKITKKGYRATNKHPGHLAKQLLSSRAIVGCNELRKEDSISKGVQNSAQSISRLLLTRNISIASDRDFSRQDQRESSLTLRRDRSERFNFLRHIEAIIDASRTLEEIDAVIESEKHPTTNRTNWIRLQSIKICDSFSWCSSEVVRQTIRIINEAGKIVRRDAVEYEVNESVHFGFVQSIYKSCGRKQECVVLVRRLKGAQPESGNVRVVNEYGNRRYMYVESDEDVKIDCIQEQNIRRMVMLIPDPWQCSKRFGADYRTFNLPDNRESRKSAAFFEVAGYQFTSFPEQSAI
ncbi:hypothetical protein FGB62_243g015 [Gracilaria domingensis]|nr:hypothetical protein FGB62_243g015 [Gracilaria domingensis]